MISDLALDEMRQFARGKRNHTYVQDTQAWRYLRLAIEEIDRLKQETAE